MFTELRDKIVYKASIFNRYYDIIIIDIISLTHHAENLKTNIFFK